MPKVQTADIMDRPTLGLVDAMAHLDDARVSDAAGCMLRAAAAGVSVIVNAGVDPEAEIGANALPAVSGCRVYRAFGLHPQAVGRCDLNLQRRALEQLLERSDAVAIGEVGLDRRPGMPQLDAQIQALEMQLELAQQRRLPVILHQVRVTDALVEVLGRYALPRGGMVHGFTGSAESLHVWLKLGLMVSFGGRVTDSRARRCREAAKAVPMERLLVESDTPDHAVHGRAEQSEPADIREVLAALAALRDEPLDLLAHHTTANARALFGLQRASHSV